MSLKKFASFVSKVTIEVGRISLSSFPWIVTLQSYVMNASLYSYFHRFSKQVQTLYPGEPNNENVWYVNNYCAFETRKWQILKMTLHASEKRP